MPNSDEPTDEERETLALVTGLRAYGDVAALVALVQGGDGGPERARDALTVLAELDPELIVQVALDALIHAHIDAEVTAPQTRRVVRDR